MSEGGAGRMMFFAADLMEPIFANGAAWRHPISGPISGKSITSRILRGQPSTGNSITS
jgi:hypothetical protein